MAARQEGLNRLQGLVSAENGRLLGGRRCGRRAFFRSMACGLWGTVGLLWAPGRSCAGDLDFLTTEERQPALRLLFSANSRGLVEPCPTCGKRALGGLARRARHLGRRRAEGVPTAYVAGPYELIASRALNDIHVERKREADAMTWGAAQNLLRPLVGFATQAETAMMAQAGGLPYGFSPVHDAPVVRRHVVGGARLAFVLFPELPEAFNDECVMSRFQQSMLNPVIAAGQKAADADLVIGVSPWGFAMEGRALERLAGSYDVVLGAGAGAHFPYDAPAFAPGVVWVRSDADGRELVELTFSRIPSGARPRSWVRGVDVEARSVRLGDDVPDDPAMRALLEGRQ